MSPRRFTAFRIDEELLDALHFVADRDGMSVPDQVRQAIREWLVRKDARPKGKPKKRPSTRSS